MPIVRRMVDDFLAGASLRSIARWLNDEGVKPPRVAIWYEEAQAKGHRAKTPPNQTWGFVSVKTVLSQPALAGLVSHKGKLVYDEHGGLVFAGEGIVALAERARVLAELERRSVLVRNPAYAGRVGVRTGGGRPAQYLMTGFARCGECGLAAARLKPAQRDVNYRCASKQLGQRCRGCYISGPHLEQQVVSRLRARLSALGPGDRLLDEIAERWHTQKLPAQESDRRVLEEARQAAEDRIADLYAARYQRGEFSKAHEVAIYDSLMRRLREQRDAAQATLHKLPPRPGFDVAELLDGELSIETWPTLPVVRQRFLLGLAVHQVWIYSADLPLDERILVVWHGEQLPAPRREQTNAD